MGLDEKKAFEISIEMRKRIVGDLPCSPTLDKAFRERILIDLDALKHSQATTYYLNTVGYCTTTDCSYDI
ncbi:hypothetical protein A2U01_0018357 [Trifolium medium]|uniref:Uncharacterized protein n=1 Tax=Trifolium medium TaxID=97028 RepID=A0A392NDF6_9FABA|nr:hypothetical protein [Trifolium medium]